MSAQNLKFAQNHLAQNDRAQTHLAQNHHRDQKVYPTMVLYRQRQHTLKMMGNNIGIPEIYSPQNQFLLRDQSPFPVHI
jgi:hypothetical protein